MSWPKAERPQILHRARPLRRLRSKTFTVVGWASRAVDMIAVRMEGIPMTSRLSFLLLAFSFHLGSINTLESDGNMIAKRREEEDSGRGSLMIHLF